MSISSYTSQEGKTFWKVYINLRSKIDPRIRVQREERRIESKGKAERREKELNELCLREIIQKEGSQPTFGEIVDKWEKYRRDSGEIQEDTIDDYLSAIRLWCEPIIKKPASEINKQEVRQVISHLSLMGKSNSFQLRVLNGVKRVYTWGKEEGLIKGGFDSITAGIRVSKVEEKVPEVLTAEEIKKFLYVAKTQNHKWYPIWLTAILTGMRSGELYALEWKDIDFANNNIVVSKSFNKRKRVIKSTKAGYFRTVPINQSLKEMLLALRASSPTPYVLPRIREWTMGLQAQELRKFCLEVGIRSVKFHALRSCFATHLLNEGVSLTTLMKVAGWRELATVQKYTRLTGIHEKGATDCLDRFTPSVNDENILKMRGVAGDGLK